MIVTSGRFAGKKAVVAKTYDEGNKVLLTHNLETQIPTLTCRRSRQKPQRRQEKNQQEEIY